MPNPVVVRKSSVKYIEHRKNGGQLNGGSESWFERIEAPGWRLYDYAIHVVSERNAEANISVDEGGISIQGRTSWEGGFGAGGNWKAEVTAWFWTVFDQYTPANIRAVASLVKEDPNGYALALSRISNSLSAETSPRRVALQASNGQFVCAEGGGGREVVANRNAALGWETFNWIPLAGNKIALQADNGQFVCAEGGGGREVVANRDLVGDWEKFDLIDLGGGKIALEAHNGQFVCAEGGGGREVVANRNAVAGWETFTLNWK